MRCTFLMAALVSTFLCTPAAFARRGGGAVFSSPLNLPLLTAAQASNLFTHLGSFTVPNGSFTGFVFGGGALSVSGSTMYMSSLVYEPVGGGELMGGLGSFTPPSTLCSGYAGGTACTATVDVSPRAPGVIPPATYTLTSGYTSGSTCAVFSALPVGITANAGWFLNFSGGATDDSMVTSVGTCNGADSVGWTSPLSTTYGTSVSVYQWNPAYNYTTTTPPAAGDTSITLNSMPSGVAANANWYIAFNNTNTEEITGISGNTVSWATPLSSAGGGFTSDTAIYQGTQQGVFSTPGGGDLYFTGSLVQNGTLYVTGGGSYDGNNNNQMGWIATAPTGITGTWGVASPAGGSAVTNIVNSGTGGIGTEPSRFFAGPISVTPSIWQPIIGPDFESGGPGFSISGTAQSWGPAFQSFNLSTVSSTGTTVDATSGLAYYDKTGESLEDRAFSGPFPLTTTTGYYPATLSVAPAQGDTSETLVLPTSTITFTASVATTGEMSVTAFSGAAFSDNAVTYDLSGTGIPNGATMQPAFDYAPGATLTTGNYWEGDAPTAAISSESLTATPAGYQGAAAWKMFFSDGSSAIGTISGSTFTPFTPLTGCVSTSPCTTSVTVGPMGDEYFNGYDGQNGGGFIVPGTSTYVAFYDHNYGLQRPKNSKSTCDPNSSESWWTPLYPDTQNYQTIGMYMYKMSDLLAAYNGSQAPYTASPYDYMSFPDEANLVPPSSCVITTLGNTYAIGWSYFDYATDIWYVATGATPTIINEYHVNAP